MCGCADVRMCGLDVRMCGCVGLRMCTYVNVSAYVGEVYMFGKVEKHGICVSAYCEREYLGVVCVVCEHTYVSIWACVRDAVRACVDVRPDECRYVSACV